MASKAVDSVKDVGKSLVNGIKGVLKIGSPSKVFEQIGVWSAQGLGIGFEDEMETIQDNMTMGMNGLTTSLAANVSADAPDGYGSGDTYNGGAVTINVYGAEGQNVDDLAKAIAIKFQDMFARKEAAYA